MNEQLLLSKAFWKNDEFDDAMQSIINMKTRIVNEKWEEITKEDYLKYLDSIEIAIESMPKYVGVFDRRSGVNYRGFTYYDLVEAFAFYVFIQERGKKNAHKPIFDTYCLSLDSYIREYACAYDIDAFKNLIKLVRVQSVGKKLSFLLVSPCKSKWMLSNDDGIHGTACLIPKVMVKDGKLGIIKNEYLEYFKQHGGGNYEALYLESHPECRDTYNAYNKELDDICKKWDEQEKVWDELNEKVKSYKQKINELNETIENNNEEKIGLNKKLFKGKATKQRIEELNSEIESLKKEVDNITKAKENVADQSSKIYNTSKKERDEKKSTLMYKYQMFLEENDGLIEYEWRD